MAHLPSPGLWCGPGFGAGLDGVCAALQEQLHQLNAVPAARPAERCAPEQVVTHIRTGAAVEEQGCKAYGLFGHYGFVERRDIVQYRPANPWVADIRPATIKHQTETFQVQALIFL